MNIANFFTNKGTLLPPQNESVGEATIIASKISNSGHPFHGVGYISSNEFYLTRPTEVDTAQFAKWSVSKPDFFFAPFNNAVAREYKAFAAAAYVLFGDMRTQTLAVRLKGTDEFLGAIKFEGIKDSDTAELSYFFDPSNHNKGLGTQSVLRAVHWLVEEGGSKELFENISKIVASVAPENTPSVKILRKAGLKVAEDGFLTNQESSYFDKYGKPESRILMSARIPADVAPALAAALNAGYYSLDTLVT